VSWSSCQRILSEELQMKRVAAKFMPRAHGWSKAVPSGCMLWIERTLGNRPWPFFEGHYQWQKLVLCLWPRDEAAVKRMEDLKFTTSQKSAASEVECQDDADFFFWCKRHCSPIRS
jgi:hypothetical protein